jgi:hypothetical protein
MLILSSGPKKQKIKIFSVEQIINDLKKFVILLRIKNFVLSHIEKCVVRNQLKN